MIDFYDSRTQLSVAELDKRIEEEMQDCVYSDENLVENLLGCIDYTSLKDDETPETMLEFYRKAMQIRRNFSSSQPFASLCVFPQFVGQIKQLSLLEPITIASVAGNFPSGLGSLQKKKEEVKYAIDQGASEIDYVITKSFIHEKKYEELYSEVLGVKELDRNICLKVILETGEIELPQSVFDASMAVLNAGANFIKTSTGKIEKGASLGAAFLMLSAINEFKVLNGQERGFKASGGIVDLEQAIRYYKLTSVILGLKTPAKTHFRIGASSLVEKIVNNTI